MKQQSERTDPNFDLLDNKRAFATSVGDQLAGGFMGALILPMLGAAALYFRYRCCDVRLMPGRLWDIGLWVSCAGLFVAGAYALYEKVLK